MKFRFGLYPRNNKDWIAPSNLFLDSTARFYVRTQSRKSVFGLDREKAGEIAQGAARRVAAGWKHRLDFPSAS
jgi:hypothetical protein